jgi:type I restriction enzyme M protein
MRMCRASAKAAKVGEIRGHNHVLTPGRYVGAVDVEDDDVPFVDRFAALKGKLEAQFSENRALEELITTGLRRLTCGE